MEIVFRVDGGGAGLGLGHLMRCLALADAFREKGRESLFICRDFIKGVQVVKEHGYEMRTIPVHSSLEQDLELTIQLAASAEVVVGDSYAFTTDYLAELQRKNKIVVYFDDKMDRRLPVKVVIGNVYADRISYGNKLSRETVLLSGFEHLSLRKEFHSFSPKKISDEVEHLLVTFGGEDPLNLTLKAVKALAHYPKKLKIDLLIGAAYRAKEELIQAIRRSPQTCLIHQDLLNVQTLYQQADMALTASGTTLWELIATGVPLIAIQSADNQELAVDYIVKNKLGLFFGNADAFDSKKINAALHFMEDKQTRLWQSQSFQGLIDGKGAQRIVSKIDLLQSSL